jgi:hypothetical protein
MELEKTIEHGLFGETIEYGVPRCVYVYLKALADVIEKRALKRINKEIAWVLENLGKLKKKHNELQPLLVEGTAISAEGSIQTAGQASTTAATTQATGEQD